MEAIEIAAKLMELSAVTAPKSKGVNSATGKNIFFDR